MLPSDEVPINLEWDPYSDGGYSGNNILSSSLMSHDRHTVVKSLLKSLISVLEVMSGMKPKCYNTQCHVLSRSLKRLSFSEKIEKEFYPNRENQ